MVEDVYQTFSDPDGNFVEQFQTTGFDARFFELYLYAYFSRSGYEVDRSHPKPDFLVKRQTKTIAVEATTVNPSTSGAVAKFGKRISRLREEGRLSYQQNELPIRFGSALLSKLKHRYWELPQCTGLPFVIAIEAFHDKEALQFSDNSLASYLYGLRDSSYWTDEGELIFKSEKVSTHTIGEKTIQSGFFHQPNTESVSAILFTNSGTSAKFSRMGYQSGYANATLNLKRSGFAYDFDPNAMDPTLFAYDLDDPPFVEDWGQGLVILHNPNAVHPLPPDFFEKSVQWRFEDDDAVPYIRGWHAYRSETLISWVGELKERLPKVLLPHGPQAVGSVDKRRFHILCPNLPERIVKNGEEDGWFADQSDAFLGLILKSNRGENWKCFVFARNEYFNFYPIAQKSGYRMRILACKAVQHKILELLFKPQRIFPQFGPPGQPTVSPPTAKTKTHKHP